MNIFILSTNPVEAAQMQCDKHVVKMVLESAQLLCSVYEPGTAPYNRTHYNHPCAIWARASLDNYEWLLDHADALCAEYTYRYDKRHKSQDIIEWCRDTFLYSFDDNLPFSTLPADRTPFAQAMPEQYRHSNPVIAYRRYYKEVKADLLTYTKRPMPEWINANDHAVKIYLARSNEEVK